MTSLKARTTQPRLELKMQNVRSFCVSVAIVLFVRHSIGLRMLVNQFQMHSVAIPAVCQLVLRRVIKK
ncbi:hypothetical protein D9M69_511880 [compost metagenome]